MSSKFSKFPSKLCLWRYQSEGAILSGADQNCDGMSPDHPSGWITNRQQPHSLSDVEPTHGNQALYMHSCVCITCFSKVKLWYQLQRIILFYYKSSKCLNYPDSHAPPKHVEAIRYLIHAPKHMQITRYFTNYTDTVLFPLKVVRKYVITILILHGGDLFKI